MVDAIDGGYPPGTVKRLYRKEIDFLRCAQLSVHQVGFQEVLALARIRSRYPENMVLIGVQPQNLEWGTQLSYEVNLRIPKVIAMIYQQVEAWAETSVDAD
ncbi:Hydrogenase 1 maturation protease [bioreactor metagenome]|uniref:Hydrogenase 1 maturation protease n=1 Tax=bioreactor metagenome TaxID=1076179 RepID=A0A645HUC5_9ZZZZ